MRHKKLWIILAALFLLEGTLLPWLIPTSWQTRIHVNPHLVLVIILYIGLFIDRHMALAFGLVFGILHDFMYFSPMLGPVAFGMGLAGYLAGLMHGRLYSSIMVCMMVIGIGDLFFETVIFGLYRLFRITHLNFEWTFLHEMLPTMLINLMFALAVYVPIRKLFEGFPVTPRQHAE